MAALVLTSDDEGAAVRAEDACPEERWELERIGEQRLGSLPAFMQRIRNPVLLQRCDDLCRRHSVVGGRPVEGGPDLLPLRQDGFVV